MDVLKIFGMAAMCLISLMIALFIFMAATGKIDTRATYIKYTFENGQVDYCVAPYDGFDPNYVNMCVSGKEYINQKYVIDKTDIKVK